MLPHPSASVWTPTRLLGKSSACALSVRLRVFPQPLKVIPAQTRLAKHSVKKFGWDVAPMLVAEHHCPLAPVRLFTLPDFMLAGAFQSEANLPKDFPKLPISRHRSQPQKFFKGFFPSQGNNQLSMG